MNRRHFIKYSSAGAAVLGTTAWIARGQESPNARINIGIIGTGGRGQHLMREIFSYSKDHNLRVTAVCDVWQKNLASAAAAAAAHHGESPKQFTRFRDLLTVKDLDAVVIATPDFAHAAMLIAALRARKDVYIEKPMTIDIPSANQALDLTRANGCVVQVGTQRRNEGRYRAAAKVVQSGVLGEISRVTSAINFNQARWARSYDDCKAEDVDWDAFLMHLRKRPFDAKQFRRWQLYRDFTNGVPGLWMTHFSDNLHFVTGATYPTRAVALGGAYVWRDGREHTDTFHTLIEYGEGFLFDWAMGLANSAGGRFTIHGTKGTYDLDARTLSAAGGQNSDIETRKIPDEPNRCHMANWIECLRSRRDPDADIVSGHQHVVASVMAATAYETGRRQVYDADRRRMTAG